MTDHEPAADETAALRARLDLETVLNEVVDSGRALTGASLGGITTIDEAGAPQTFVTSGFTEAEHRRMAEWADGPRLFEHFRALEGPLRSADFTAYVHALGFPTDRLPFKTVQITPMHHRGVLVGNFYLAEKAGGEAFTDEDEEVLVLFASQAATAIANARTYRADVEALIETSPVGVVVFDARTGALGSLNREAARIVKSLCGPGQSAEQLLGVITCRRADGREIALDRAETVRSEEVALSVPDGRSVTTLINATPLHDPDGPDDALASVVVTLQGPGAASGSGAHAGGVPEHGEPRAARAADLDQGLGRHGAPRLAHLRPGRSDAVLPHHRRAGRPHGQPDWRPARRRAHRNRDAVGRARALGGRRPRGLGPRHVRQRRRAAHRPHRPAARPAPGHG